MAELIIIAAYIVCGMVFAGWAKSGVEARGKVWLISGPFAPLLMTMVVAFWLPIILAAVLTDIFEGRDHG